jgi:eukaryotic-like serine/threonine-protein kinase
MDNIIGKKLDGRYEIQEIIGIGGMAVVYKAYDSIDDRIVAVKVLKEEYLKNDEFRRRFKNESKAVAVLSHPNIVKVYDVSFGDRIQYIVMEYIDGITLKEYIEQQKVLTWKEAVHFTVQILRALSHAHERGIVHRDIKPQNIMMLEDGTIKVTDFGIARFAHSETKTMTDKAIGSVHYISPEQARGSLTDEKSDIYSVGVMLFEMLTGDLPFEADSAVSVAIMQMQENPRKPRSLNPDIPEGLEDITLRAMQKDPSQRYQSAIDMLEDIERFKRNPSIHFQYKYFVDESPTKYVDAIKEVKHGDGLEADDYMNKKLDKNKKGKKSNFLPILAGITAALVLVVVAMIVIVLAIKGALGTGGNVTVPNFVGMQIDEATAKYPDFTLIKTTAYDATAPVNQITKQDTPVNTSVKKGAEIKVTVSLGSQQLTVPTVDNTDKTQAIATIKAEGFTNVVEQPQYNSDVAVGNVIGTTPEGGSKAAATDTITVLVSLGSDTGATKPVPKVTGLSPDAAIRAIQDAGFVYGTTTLEYSSTVKSGLITRADPKEGTPLTVKTTVNLFISKGAQPSSATTVKVPKLIGLTLQEAESKLGASKLSVGNIYGVSDLNGIVTDVNPNEGVSVDIGATVDLTVVSQASSSPSSSSKS